MPQSTFQQLLKGVTPGMVWYALKYHLRTAFRLVENTQPALHGLAFWQAVLDTLLRPDKPVLLPFQSFDLLGDVVSFQTDEHQRVKITTQNGSLFIVPLAADLVRITASMELPGTPRDPSPEAPFSYGVSKPEQEWPPIEVNVSETENLVEISCGGMQVLVDKQPCSITIRDMDGNTLLSEVVVGCHPQTRQIICRARYDKQSNFYGLGEKAGSLELSGKKFELWNTDPLNYLSGVDPIYMSIPFLMNILEGKAAGYFFDNSYRSWVDIGSSKLGRIEYRALKGEFCVYVSVGRPQTVLERYTELTGRMNLLPLWALGFHQARWSYAPQERLMEIARTFREHRIPCDALYLDIDYMDGYRCFTWHPQHFPEPSKMITALHLQGFKVVTIVDPGIKIDPAYKVYQEGIKSGYFMNYPDHIPFIGPVWPGDCHFPDFSDPQVREWWGYNQRALLEAGVDGIWNDMNEIALISGITRPVPDIIRHVKDGQTTDHAEIHNVYGLLMTRACFEGQKRLKPDRRPFSLTRSGWAGTQRYAMHWTGDNSSTWEHLALHIQMVLAIGLSGVAMTSADVGGFHGGPGPELYTRWMQVGAFMPFFRVHSMKASPDQEPWSFGLQVENICRKYIELRYRLLPYTYTAMWQATQNGSPLVRPLFWANSPDRLPDPQVNTIQDEYLYGDAFLVAPIIEKGAESRKVYLPDGIWFNFWTNEPFPGGQIVTADAPLDTLPLFVQGGAVIPFWPVQQHTADKEVDTLELQAYWSTGTFTSQLYEDDGFSPEPHTADMSRISEFTLHMDGENHGGLKRSIRQGNYKPAYTSIHIQIVGINSLPADIELVGGDLLSHTYDAQHNILSLKIRADADFELLLGF